MVLHFLKSIFLEHVGCVHAWFAQSSWNKVYKFLFKGTKIEIILMFNIP